MDIASWKRPLSWVLLVLALAGFILSLGFHLAAWSGSNVDLAVPGLVQVVRVGAVVGIPIGLLGNIYLIWNKRWRATYATLPIWLRLVMQWSVLLLVLYWFLYSAATFNPFPGTGDGAATLHFRDESCRWLALYGIVAQAIIQISWGWLWLVPRNVPHLSAPR